MPKNPGASRTTAKGGGASHGTGGGTFAAGGRGRAGRPIGAWRIASTYIGTVVGAGFASGQEILRFFTAYDGWGTLGLLGVTALLAAFGILIMRWGAATGSESHREVLRAAAGPWVGTLADWVVTGFLFTGTGVMIAASNALFREQLGWPGWLGSLVMAAATVVTVLFRLTGITWVTALVAPVLMLAALGVSGFVLAQRGWPAAGTRGADIAGAAPVWPLAAVLYASFNLILAMPVLAPLGAQVQKPATLGWGGLAGGIGLGLAALALHLAVWSGLPASARFQIPMLALARGLGPVVASAYAVVLWLEVYTTAVTSLYGVAARLRSPVQRGFPWVVVGLGAGALALSFWGFANMVTRLYPLVGYLGLVIMGAMAWRALGLAGVGVRPAMQPSPAFATAAAGAGSARPPAGPGISPPEPGPVTDPSPTARPLAATPRVPRWGARLAARSLVGMLIVTAATLRGSGEAAVPAALAVAAGAGLGLGVAGWVVDRLAWALVLAPAGAIAAALLEFGLGSLWLCLLRSLHGWWSAGAGLPHLLNPAAPLPPLPPGAPAAAIPWVGALLAALVCSLLPPLASLFSGRRRPWRPHDPPPPTPAP